MNVHGMQSRFGCAVGALDTTGKVSHRIVPGTSVIRARDAQPDGRHAVFHAAELLRHIIFGHGLYRFDDIKYAFGDALFRDETERSIGANTLLTPDRRFIITSKKESLARFKLGLSPKDHY